MEAEWTEVDDQLLREVRRLEGRELDFAVEDEVMDWRGLAFAYSHRAVFPDVKGPWPLRFVGRYSSDPSAIARVERRIMERGLGVSFGRYLAAEVLGPTTEDDRSFTSEDAAALATAPPTARCRAALLAVRRERADE